MDWFRLAVVIIDCSYVYYIFTSSDNMPPRRLASWYYLVTKVSITTDLIGTDMASRVTSFNAIIPSLLPALDDDTESSVYERQGDAFSKKIHHSEVDNL